MKIISVIVALLCLSTATVAAIPAIDKKYRETTFEIINNTTYAQLIYLQGVQGKWTTPWAFKTTIFLNPSQVYRNTLVSIRRHHYFMSATRLRISRMEDKTQYFIFKSTNLSRLHSISGNIIEGQGSIFVKSRTNACSEVDAQGDDFCEIRIED